MLQIQAFVAGAALLSFLAVPAVGNATPITETFDFSASGFGSGAPIPSITGSATLSFDPSMDQTATPVLSFSSAALATYVPVTFIGDAASNLLVFGNNCAGFACSESGGSNQFAIVFHVDSAGMPVAGSSELSYATTTSSAVFSSTSSTVTLGTAVPEPTSLALLAPAVFGLSVVRRRRRGAA